MGRWRAHSLGSREFWARSVGNFDLYEGWKNTSGQNQGIMRFFFFFLTFRIHRRDKNYSFAFASLKLSLPFVSPHLVLDPETARWSSSEPTRTCSWEPSGGLMTPFGDFHFILFSFLIYTWFCYIHFLVLDLVTWITFSLFDYTWIIWLRWVHLIRFSLFDYTLFIWLRWVHLIRFSLFDYTWFIWLCWVQ